MLVIASDMHLTDGTTGATTSAGAFALFVERLRELALAASWRADGHYRPVEQIDLVLLGDTLDPIHSAQWNASPVRPWSDPDSPEFLETVSQITAGILKHNAESLAILCSLAVGGIGIPPALRNGRPSMESEEELVRVRVHYMVGNHDWFYHLPGTRFDGLRQQVIRQMGLSNRPQEPFPHEMAESDELSTLMRRHQVYARHGDLFDPLNFDGDRATSSLGDAIVIELCQRFAAEVADKLANELPAGVVLGLREIDNVRPAVLVPLWIDGLLERTCTAPAMRKRVKALWDRLVDEFLAIEFVRCREAWGSEEAVDELAWVLRFGKRISIGWANAVSQWYNGLRGSRDDSYVQHALAEQDFRNRRAKYLVYGHTHTAETIPMDASYAEGYVLNQMYFNTGTWRRVHRQTRLAPAEHEFIASDVMTYTAFFQGDERKGRPFETWSGVLGYCPWEVTIHRIDPGRTTHAPGQSVSTPTVHGLAPHFTVPASHPGCLSGH